MPCLVVIILFGFPRLGLFLFWLLTTYIQTAFQTRIWPFLGFLFLPYTTLAYMWAANATDHQISGGWVFLIVLGVIFDLASTGSAKRRRKHAWPM
ncbi:MAG: hypothetical protein JWN51_910 [Phycisphaerales bacterium]|nr:hypothetical protein [Phycisphaerales bacterium]